MALAARIDRRAAETLIGLSIPMDGSWARMGGEAALERILVSFTACSVRVTACASFMLAPKPDVLVPGAGAQGNHLKSATTRVSNTNTLQDIQVLPISDPKFAGHWLPRLRWASPFSLHLLATLLGISHAAVSTQASPWKTRHSVGIFPRTWCSIHGIISLQLHF